jgi:hypothetical protein
VLRASGENPCAVAALLDIRRFCISPDCAQLKSKNSMIGCWLIGGRWQEFMKVLATSFGAPVLHIPEGMSTNQPTTDVKNSMRCGVSYTAHSCKSHQLGIRAAVFLRCL